MGGVEISKIKGSFHTVFFKVMLSTGRWSEKGQVTKTYVNENKERARDK